MDLTNQKVNGYNLLHKLGEGGMAEVWYAQNGIGKQAAVKILKADLSLNQEIVTRFENEAKIMVKLTHPNIRQVYDFSSLDNRPCIIMEYLEGRDLKELLRIGVKFSDDQLISWWNQMVDALNYTHSKQIIHRDIKPSNIFLTNEGQIKLLDFGIAKVINNISHTHTGMNLGTIVYMSPEQIKDSKHLDFRTDAYSLAVTFFHLLSGKIPYEQSNSSTFEILNKIVNEDLDLNLIPVSWKSFLLNYLKKNPLGRSNLAHFNSQQNDVAFSKQSEHRAYGNEDNTKIDSFEFVNPVKNEIHKSTTVKKKKSNLNSIIISVVVILVIILIVFAIDYYRNNQSNDSNFSYQNSIDNDEIQDDNNGQLYNLVDSYGDTYDYDGEIYNDVPHGQGKSYYANGDINIGSYKNGKREGYSEYTFSKTGNVYKGNFENDRINGYGTIYNKYGEIISEGYFENDKLVK